MQISNDPMLNKLIISVIMGLVGLLNGAGLYILNEIKKDISERKKAEDDLKKIIEEIFNRMREVEAKLHTLHGEHTAYHGGKK